MPSTPNVSLEQWDLWLDDPVTQALRAWASEKRSELRDMWEGGHFKSPDHFESAIKDSAAQGACSILQEIEALVYESVTGADKNVSTVRVEDGTAEDVPSAAGY